MALGINMSDWKEIALKKLPEFRSEIEDFDSPMQAWVNLFDKFSDSVRVGNVRLTHHFFEYALWCLNTSTSGATDESTAAWCAFYEDLPHVPYLGEKLHHFLSLKTFEIVKDAFKYHTSKEEFSEFCSIYLANMNATRETVAAQQGVQADVHEP